MTEVIILLMGIAIAFLVYMVIKRINNDQSGSEISEFKIMFQDGLNKLSSQVRERMTEEQTARDTTAKMLTEHMLALSTNVGDVKAALSNSQRRGQFGEHMFEDLLKKAGLEEGLQYIKQPTMEGGRRPDFAILLPADTHQQRMSLNVDCKFPLDNYVRFINAADGSEEQETAKKNFISDTRNQVQQVATRDYNFGDSNLNFVVIFFPNESIYAAAIELNPNLVDEAIEKNVVIASPNTMYGLLVIVQQSARQMQLQKNANQLFPLIEALEKQAEEYFKQIDAVAGQLATFNKNFDFVTGRRKNALRREFNKIANFTKENSIEGTGTLGELDSPDIDLEDDLLAAGQNTVNGPDGDPGVKGLMHTHEQDGEEEEEQEE